jgi:hypothetical protein
VASASPTPRINDSPERNGALEDLAHNKRKPLVTQSYEDEL